MILYIPEKSIVGKYRLLTVPLLNRKKCFLSCMLILNIFIASENYSYSYSLTLKGYMYKVAIKKILYVVDAHFKKIDTALMGT